uniref:protein GLUTAMINE DUMPER 2-like n=1 Tax=Erigeron canadensis TaxID=72917 RepID=UPI001CB90515|nr:protein GLUTAMINE DUMPER 2-like [Erigeron canadensis]
MATTISAAPPLSRGSPQPSPWHSPVPYLFGGLAAMLGLIAFALLILACSYWKLSGYLNSNGDNDDIESSGNENNNNNNDFLRPLPDQINQLSEDHDMAEEKYFVIMAGEAKPTFLATPISSSRTTSFGSSSWRSNLSSLSSENHQDQSSLDHNIS